MIVSPDHFGVPRKGALVLVVGPSGSGKDTIIGLARDALKHDHAVIFPRRVVTRPAQTDAEDHDSLDPVAFEAARREGKFALSWGAHGLFYGITAESLAPVAAGAIAVINVSRGIIATAEAIDCRITVLSIVCRPELLAERIAKRGRESEADILARLNREAPIRTTTARLVEVVNETHPEDIRAAVIAAIRSA
jgi:phosphonate metabolism protein PhnN/1,5-bisphosphokinase (PRPP-forming)